MAYTTINKSGDYFNTKLYTGNGSTQSITGVGFQPDLIWIKDRDATDWHWWNDAVRGATKTIHSNTTSAESTQATSITAFNTDGFTLGNDGAVNRNNDNYASWNWLASNTSGSSNTDGSITSTVSANTTSGFSIVKYTGTNSNSTIGQGLGAVPKMMIIKNIGSSYEWCVYHEALAANQNLYLNTTAAAAESDVGDVWNSTAPTTTTFGVGGNKIYTNYQSENYIAYCFAEKTGYSKFGSYTGNGNADGTFVYTGFKPAWVMRKYSGGGSASGEGWEMLDSARSPFNVADERLKADSNGAESTGSNYYVDFLSNGFKCRTVDNATNNSGATYIYMAFAAEPLVGDNPATAR